MNAPEPTPKSESSSLPRLDVDHEPSCECMVCDLPLDAAHGPVEWKLVVWFPGPYPHPGESHMLLCDHCKTDWVDGDWDEESGRFVIIQCTRV